ncbi:MAG: type II toxin-antitoxin system RelE/ParE family toxin [Caldilineaceae bacterium]|nr:type II toxin-antitoxin system RelE/ParE family toxin [Caldilineaceae bacterium]MBP8109673.1 type II toxin-antitoxin system RelE/ParE family toxin [Caldilineaceae bacterium]MBP8125507.1 type II toxin-antitoxin system RelE/ParE family toxin [Caldilineaceae bacterium]MBP9073605.1 type II toxin-antitoxin system RelE/ParE family toxin [Caldilineaceae bacterium]
MAYRLKFESQARQHFRSLIPQIKREVLAEIEALLDDPFPIYAKPLIREWTGAFRIHIDGWRLIYEVDTADQTVTIMRIVRRDSNTYL